MEDFWYGMKDFRYGIEWSRWFALHSILCASTQVANYT